MPSRSFICVELNVAIATDAHVKIIALAAKDTRGIRMILAMVYGLNRKRSEEVQCKISWVFSLLSVRRSDEDDGCWCSIFSHLNYDT